MQRSVWITPDPVEEERTLLTGGEVDVESLVVLEARPAAGGTDVELVAGAWDFEAINSRYAMHMGVLARRPKAPIHEPIAAAELRQWAEEENASWLAAVSGDPLLPARLHPAGYLGPEAWRGRVESLGLAAEQVRQFRG